MVLMMPMMPMMPAHSRMRSAALGCVISVVVMVFSGCGGTKRASTEPAPTPPTTTSTQSSPRYVDLPTAIAQQMTDQQLIGQLVMTKIRGTTLTEDEGRALRRGELNGVILFGWNDGGRAALRSLTSDIAQRGVPITVGTSSTKRYVVGSLVAADQEGGSIRALPSVPPERSQQSWGDNPQRATDIERANERAGAALRAAGITVNLAPVADLPVGPAQVMAARSFGPTPGTSVAHAVRGFQRGGIAVTAKHFPGLGGASRNTDEGIAHVTRTRTQMQRDDIEPFRRAADAGVLLVMTSHAIYDTLGSRVPATIDRSIAHDLLRRELGDSIVVISDSLNAKGVREASGLTTPQLCPAAAAAGVDILLLTGSLETAQLCGTRMRAALANPASGVTHEQLVRSVIRVLRLKQHLGLIRDARTKQPVRELDHRCCAP